LAAEPGERAGVIGLIADPPQLVWALGRVARMAPEASNEACSALAEALGYLSHGEASLLRHGR